jgi:hypothetical protein
MMKPKNPRLHSKPGTDLAQYVHPSRVPDPEKPHQVRRLNQTPGGQVRVTPTVKKFARQFKITDNIRSVARVIDAVKRQIQYHKATAEEAKSLYARRTATDIIHSKKAIVLAPEERVSLHDIRGCVDYGLALTATLRALGMDAEFARRGHRTIVFFRHGGKEYFVDPSRHTRDPTPEELTSFQKKVFKTKEDWGGFKRGKDAWDIGMKSIGDFERYVGSLDVTFNPGALQLSNPRNVGLLRDSGKK